jgi:hypothetical protein
VAGSSDLGSHRNFEAEPGDAAYGRLVDAVSLDVEAWLGRSEGDVIVLAPCGCSRTELLKRLMNKHKEPGELLFSKAYAYKGFRRKAGAPQGVDEYASLEELVGKLKEWSGGRVAVVPESSCEAVALKQMLEKEAPYLRVQLLYLPQLYKEAAQGYSEDVKELARVEHSKLEEVYKCKAEGCSSTLLRAWSEGELEELGKAKEAILVLSPGRLGLRDYLVEAAGKMPIALAAAPFGAAVALAVDRLLGALASLSLQGAAQALLAKVGGVSVKQAEGFASRVLEGWSRPEARNKVAEGLAKLVAAAREAAPHLDREELETVVDQVALEWGMDAPTFKVFVKNLAKMASGELVTREELRKELEKLVGKELEERLKRLIEDRLREIEKELKELQESVKGLKIGVGLFYAHELEAGSLYSNFKVEKGKPVIASQEEKVRVEAELVTAGSFERLAGEVVKRLEGGFVVLEGPKGIGKSTLAAYTAWRALLNGQVDAILSVSKLDVGDALRLENLVKDAGKRFFVLYDPSPLHAYYKPGAFAGEVREAAEAAEVTLRELLELAGSAAGVLVLAVLPSDLYRGLSPQLKEALENRTLHVDLRDSFFIEEVVKAYSGCQGGFGELAKVIAGFEDGYTLVAKYAGLALREKGCRIEDVQKVVEKAGGDARRFLAYYLWSVLLKGSGNLARMAAVPLILHALFGPVPEGVTYLVRGVQEGVAWRLPSPEQLRGVRPGSLVMDELKPLARWLSLMHEDLAEETLEELCILKRREPEELAEALRWAWGEILREKEGVPAIEALADFVGKRLEQVLEAASQSCWRRLALIAGSALTAHGEAPLATTKIDRLPEKALEPCELDSYLFGGVIPPLVVWVVLRRPGVLTHPLARWHREAAKELELLEGTWRSRGGAYLDEELYGLGLALAVAGAAELGESVETWEAEVALYTAVSAVQKVLEVNCVAAILDSFRRLGELAPHYYVHLVSAASKLTGLDERGAREIVDLLEGALEREELKVRGWPLVEAVRAYSNLLINHRVYFLGEEERLRGRMCKLLKELEGQLRDIAEVYALEPAFYDLKPCSGADPASRAGELLERLREMEREEPSEQAAEWAALRAFKPVEFKRAMKDLRELLTYTLAMYKMENNDLEAASELFRTSAEISEELKDWGRHLASRSLAVRCSMLGAGSLEELRRRTRTFEDLWREAKEREEPTRMYLEVESAALAEYLVFLVLDGRVGEVSELLEREGRLLRLFPDDGVVVRLLLEWLGVSVKRPEAWEVAAALRGHIYAALQPAFYALMGLPGDALGECDELGGRAREFCRAAVNAVSGDKDAVIDLKLGSLEVLSDKLPVLLEQGFIQDLEERRVVQLFYRELLDFVERLDARALVQLLVTATSRAKLILMLWALVNDKDQDLAGAHAKLGAMSYKSKLPRKLFREAAEARSEEGFKLALMKLFYYHI